MIRSGQDILKKLHKKWLFRFLLEIVLYGIGIGVLIYGFSSNLGFSVLAFTVVVMVLSLILKPWKYNLTHLSSYLDATLPQLECSTSLVLEEEKELTQLARLQREKISKEIAEAVNNLDPERSLKKAMIMLILMIAGASLISYFGLTDILRSSNKDIQEQRILFSPIDTSIKSSVQPQIVKQSIHVRYPRYTKQAAKRTTNMHVKELQGAIISWSLAFDKKVKSVHLQHMGEEEAMTLTDEKYQFSLKMENSGFYNFKFIDTLGNDYYSELYSIEMVQDKSPVIEISGLSQFTSFDVDQNKELNFKALVSDDYGLSGAVIIATVSKGSGESVKFREEKLSFDHKLPDYSKKFTLQKTINLNEMQMTPGDELYFYVEVVDIKQPNPNITRGETYFANIRDTITDVFEVEGSMGVDQMPDYYRSQRQLIIDTEKLIKEKREISKKEFNSRSNELAFDQKSLRIKYGTFMGDESTLGINAEDEEHDNEEVNILAEYEHDHDTENESNLVEEAHDEEENQGKLEEDPLHDYTHNHDDPEEATLYTKSLKAKLRMALNEMWDAELHLRLYHPEESLPIQYRILKRLQDIKNSARIYVHRIGFDPPPIKEDKRLSGDLEEVYSFKKTEELEQAVLYPFMRASVARLEVLIPEPSLRSENDRILFETAGNELAILAIVEPGKYLKTLESLKKLGQGFEMSQAAMISVQKGLISALPEAVISPEKREGASGALNTLFINELETND